MSTRHISNGVVAATTAAQIASGADGPINLTFSNVGVVSETVVLTVATGSGTARRIRRDVLAADEQLVITNLVLDPNQTLYAVTTTAACVEYYAVSGVGGPFQAFAFDANGALKNVNSGVVGNQTLTGNLAVGGTLGVTGDSTLTGALGVTGLATFASLAYPAVARTATADGLTTGTIAALGDLQFVTVTSADANHIVVLPTPTPGVIVVLKNGATGYELRTSTPASISINGGAGADAESAIAANTMVIAICTSATTWQAIGLAATTLAAVEAAA